MERREGYPVFGEGSCVSWHYLPELAEEFSGGSSSDGEQCAPLKSSPSVGRCSCDASWVDAYRSSLSGTMSERSTVNRGVEKWISSLEDSRARTSAPPAKGQESTARNLGFGGRWQESLQRYDRNLSSWRTHLCLFAEALPWSSVTLPKWGLMRSGVVYRRRTAERPINGSGCGYWPTPRNNTGPDTSKRNLSLDGAVLLFPTPRAEDSQCSGGHRGKDDTLYGLICKPKAGTMADMNQARFAWSDQRRQIWSTPTATDAIKGGKVSPRPGAMGLSEQTGGQLNPTWVEWLMGWPRNWTNLERINRDDFDKWLQETSPKDEGEQMRTMWWDRDPSISSSRQESSERQHREHRDAMPGMPYGGSLGGRDMGERGRSSSGVRNMRRDVSAKTQTEERADIVWESQMFEGNGETIGRVAVGVKHRVDRLKAIGNGQVPRVAATAWRILSE